MRKMVGITLVVIGILLLVVMAPAAASSLGGVLAVGFTSVVIVSVGLTLARD